jgi:hypothetical protein
MFEMLAIAAGLALVLAGRVAFLMWSNARAGLSVSDGWRNERIRERRDDEV